MMQRVPVLFSVLLIFGLQITSFAEITPVVDRTTEVRDAIVTAAGVNSAADVTDAQLSAITNLNLRSKGITALKSGDFSGMTGLTNLNLYGNELSSLPDKIFEGLTALTTLRLGGNTVDPMQITILLEKVGEDQIKAVVATGAPFTMSIPISPTNGSISGNTTSLTISKGAVESTAVTVTRAAGTTAAVTANIGTLSSLPSHHYGYVLSKSDTLPLEVISATSTTPETPVEPETPTQPETPENTAPTFADGNITLRSVSENSAADVNIGNAVAATDTENDTLAYTLSGLNADSFSIDSETGQLKTKNALDYETKRIYIVSVNASDETLTSTISVIIIVIDLDDTPAVSTMLAVSDRTPKVRDAIVAAIPDVSVAADVTDTHLATITSLNLRSAGISELKSGDFSGLTSLTSLNLYGNMLRNLPARIFEDLTSLTSIRLGGNLVAPMPLMVSLQQVSDNEFRAIIPTGAPFDIVLPINEASVANITIPKGSVTSGSFVATTTDVNIGNLPSIPPNHFGYILAKSTVCNRTIQVSDAIVSALQGIEDCRNISETDLATITALDLSSASISALQADDFEGLLSLSTLNLSNNQLQSLPDGVFEGLSSLTSLDLSGNTVDPLSLNMTILKVGENQIKVVISTGAPFDIVLPITVANGSLNNNATSITIPRGSIASQPLMVNRTPDIYAAVTVDFGTLPNLPTNHIGYALAKSNELPLEIYSAVNTPPVFTEGINTTRSIAENTDAGSDIGSAVTATDANNDTLTYTVSGTDAASFSINSTSGQLQTKVALDYETKDSYSVTITVSDGSLTDSIDVTINITDIVETPTTDETTDGEDTDPPNNAPVFTEGSTTTRTVAENTGSGVNIGNPVSATDADDDTLTYILGGSDATSFSIVSTNGQLRTNTALDYETRTSYSVIITVSDDNDGSDTITVTINVSDVEEALNTAPIFTEGETASRSVAENTGSGVDIGSAVSATDEDNDNLTYSLSGSDASSFSIGSANGQLRTNAALDYETKSSYSVTITVSDGKGGSDTINITINITDVDETTNTAPVFTDGSTTTRSVDENTGSGVDIGTAVSAMDADDDTLSYSLSGTDATSFSIDSSSGQLRTSAALDYETKSSYSVTINVSDGKGGSDTIAVTINVTDVDEATNTAPVFTDGSTTTRSIDENTGSGVDIGSAVSATDVDNDTLTYSLGGTDAASFSIGSTNGQLRTSTALDYETKSSYSVTITVSDRKGGSDTIAVTINITDVDEATNTAPVFTEGETASRSVAENTGSGVDIGSAVSATDEDNDTLTYSLGGTDASSFSIGSTNGQLRTSAALDYETKSSYSVTINVSDGKGGSDTIGVTINVTDVDEATNTAPTFTDGSTTTRSVDENTKSGVDISTAVSATDADDDTLSYSLSGTDATSFSIDSSSGQLRTSAALDYETKDSYSVTITVSDGNGGSASITVTINVNDIDESPVNNAPVFTNGSSTTRTIAENTASNVNIGSVVSATDADDDTLSYRMSGADAASFSIDSSSGQLRTSAALDYETKSSYSVTITVSDDQGGSSSISVTINITNVNEAPVFTAGTSTTRTIAENAGSGINIGSAVSATDVDSTTLTYTLGGTNGASFDIESTTGQLKTKAALDYETKTSYSVTITVSDGSLTDSIAVTINVRDLDETPSNIAPVFTDGDEATRTIAENTAADANIGTAIAATDEDSENLAYLLSGTDASSFAIDGDTGQLKTSAALNYETKTSYEVIVTVSDGTLEDEITVTINVTNVNEAPVFNDGDSITRQVAENTAAGTNLGNVITATDPDAEDTITYSLGGTDAASFDIVSTSGQLKTKAALDYETKNSYTVTVIATDTGDATDTITVTINVTDVDENRAPVFTDGESAERSIAENTGSGVNIGAAVAATDPDTDDTLEYSLGGTDRSSFSLGSTNGQLRTKAALDYETKNAYSVTVSVSDGNGGTDSITVTIKVTDVDENRAPVFTDGESAERSIAENTGAGVNIGTAITATDADDDTLEYSLGGTDAASFEIGSTNGQIRTKAALDYETKNAYSVTVSVSDGNGGTDSITVTIKVTDVDENSAPVFTDGESTERSIAENTLSGVDIGDAVAATDADDDTLDYSLGGTDAASFSINSTSGQIRTNAALDYETKSTYSVTVSVSDGNGGTDSITVTIKVTDVDENTAPVFTDGESTERSIAENTLSGVDIGDAVAATDADDDTLEYSLGGTDAASFSINSTSGQIRTNVALDYETKNTYSVTVSVSDGNGGSDSIAVTIKVTDVDENSNPSFGTAENVTLNVNENTGTGIDIGDKVEATDPDTDDTLEYSLGGTDASSFSIDSTSGQIRTNAALDYETKNTYSVTVSVSDGNGGTDSIPVTINVNDVNENNDPSFGTAESITLNVNENTGTGIDIGDKVEATDPDTDDTLEYSLGGTDAASFSIDSTNGQLRTNAALDHETKDTYSVTVSVSDGNGGTDSIPVTINVTDVNEAPTFTESSPTTRSIAEHTASGQNIGSAVSATDPEGDTLEYTLEGTDASSFSIVSTSGQLQTNAALDYETTTSYSVTVKVTDDTLTNTIAVTINVTDVNENTAPSFSESSFSYRISDIANASVGDSIGDKVTATDADEDTLSYSLGGDDAALFDIDSSSGQLKITQSLIDHTSSAYSIKVIATDPDSATAEISGTIFVTRVSQQVTNNPPVFDDGESTTRSVAENTASGQNIGEPVAATDDDTDDTLTYTLEGTDAASFSIVSTSGQLQTSVTLNYETKTSYSVTVKVTDDSGASNDSDTIAVTINVNDVDEVINNPPIFADDSTTLSIPENTPSGENIGSPITATDDDEGDTLTYSLEGTDASSLSIVSTSGQLQTRTALDYETKNFYSVTVKVTDDSGASNNSDTIAVAINVTDVNEGITPVADRTPAVRDAIVALVDGIDNAEDVTEGHLAAITGQLSLYYERLSALKPGDFDGLTSVTELQLNFNRISSIPSGIFDDLTSLERLEFSGLGSQNQLLTILPPGVFDNLTNLVKLNLSYQSLSSLPAGFFENLTNLTILNLYANNFSSIPAGMFVNLTNLQKLYLEANPVDPLPLPIILVAGENGQIKAFAQTGAPFDITVPISVTNGSIDGGATGVTIPIGSTDSETITITRTPGTTENVIASIGTLPSIPNDSRDGRSEHNGYAFTKGEAIDVFRTENSAPVFDDGLIVDLSIAERTRSFVNIGDPISATDADDDILTYTLGGSDAASFNIDGATGQLLTKAVLDYETKSSYSVTITVSDNFGGSASIDVAITITDLDETPPTVPLSARSEKVQQYLIGLIPDASTASDVLKIHLDSITSINMRANNITSLDPDDFKGLSALRSIDLSLNNLTSLPPGIFEGLGNVRSLDLEWNEFESFTPGMLDGLTGLTLLVLEKNYVGTLPPGLFDQLTNLRELRMGYMRLTSLPLNIFDNLTDLRDINFSENRLTSLPSRLFQGTDSLFDLNLFNNRISSVETGLFDNCPFLSKLLLENNRIESLPDGFLKGNGGLFALTLSDNPGAPFDFTIGLEQGVDGASGHFAKVKAVIPIGAPDLLYVRVNITNGIFLDSNNNHLLRENDKSIYLKIHRGAVESREYQLQRLPADSTNNNSVTVSITSLPTEGQYDTGYKYVRGVGRLVVIKSGDNIAPEFTEEESTSRSISEAVNSGINIGGPVEATDSDGDPLTYSLSGTDASSFSIDSKTGQLITSATLDYDTKNSYSVTVSVSDGYEGTDSIAVTINITEFDDSVPDVALSSRTTKVSDAIVDAIEGVTSASDVKNGHFINVTELDLSSASISSLNADDFDGLTHLTRLSLEYNSLTSLPSDIFDGLSALTYLNLQNNDLTSLPDSIFSGLSSLETLDLAGNSISSVQGDLLSGLSSLSELLLNHNKLSSLPDGFFGIGKKIDTVNLSWNTVRPLKILVSLSYVAEGQVKIVCPIGSPLLIMPNVVISPGGDAIDSETHNGLGWDAHILNPGDTESDILDIERSEGSNNAVTVTFPLITFDRNDAHSGYEYDIDESNQPMSVLPLSIPLAPTIDIPPIPEETALFSNYPNPFNPETWIPYQLSEAGNVSLTIYDMRGVVIRKLDLGHKTAGYYTDRKRAAYWDGRNANGEKVAAGVYFTTFKANDFTATRKMLILK